VSHDAYKIGFEDALTNNLSDLRKKVNKELK